MNKIHSEPNITSATSVITANDKGYCATKWVSDLSDCNIDVCYVFIDSINQMK